MFSCGSSYVYSKFISHSRSGEAKETTRAATKPNCSIGTVCCPTGFALANANTHTPTDRPTLSSSGGVVVSFPLKVCHIVLRGPVSPRTVPCRHVLSLFKSRHCWLSARLVDAANVARAAAANNADGDRGGYGAVKSET